MIKSILLAVIANETAYNSSMGAMNAIGTLPGWTSSIMLAAGGTAILALIIAAADWERFNRWRKQLTGFLKFLDRTATYLGLGILTTLTACGLWMLYLGMDYCLNTGAFNLLFTVSGYIIGGYIGLCVVGWITAPAWEFIYDKVQKIAKNEEKYQKVRK
jgi:hypothetical protein